jgi:hypothetical protein
MPPIDPPKIFSQDRGRGRFIKGEVRDKCTAVPCAVSGRKGQILDAVRGCGAQDSVRLGRCRHFNYVKSGRLQALGGCRAEDCIFFHDQDDWLFCN